MTSRRRAAPSSLSWVAGSALVLTLAACSPTPSGPLRAPAADASVETGTAGETGTARESASGTPGSSAGPTTCPSWESVAAVGGRKVTSVDPRVRPFLTDEGALSCTYNGSGRTTEITLRNTSGPLPAADADRLRTQHRVGLASIAGEPVLDPPPGLGALASSSREHCVVVAYAAAGATAFVLVDTLQTDAQGSTLCPVSLRIAGARLAGTL
ncbi:MAG: hypothetical protein NVSMB13_13080 [Mycobacteriales bacterium]